mgnify:CR=1 FL=1
MREWVPAGIDVCAVLAFVAIGRASHDEALNPIGFAGTAWPFLVGLAAGWAAVRAWRRPEALVPTGVAVWAATIVIGMVLRAVTGQGTAAAFVVVASLFLGAVLLGWRLVAGLRRAER